MERWSGLAAVPAVLTLAYPFWPPFSFDSLWPTLIPQLSAYACLALWSAVNGRRLERFFLVSHNLKKSLLLGGFVELLTGLVNLWVIVKLTPGWDTATTFCATRRMRGCRLRSWFRGASS